MLLSVIIPTCNRKDLLSNCLDLLSPSSQTLDFSFYEVIVTDDSTNSISRDFISKECDWVKWCEGPKKGPAANRNNGAKQAIGEWLIFIDDDCLPDNNLINAYACAIQDNPSIFAFEGRIYVDEPQTSLLQEAPINCTGGYFWSANICIKKDLFYLMRGFDENFPFAAMEDVEFFKRLKGIVNKHMFVYDASVVHPWRTNLKLFRDLKRRHQSQKYYLCKYPEEMGRINFKYYFLAFLRNLKFTLKNAYRFKCKGLAYKILCDFLQLYFAMQVIFDNNLKSNYFNPKINKKRL